MKPRPAECLPHRFGKLLRLGGAGGFACVAGLCRLLRRREVHP